ncbi:hypothetical protein QVG61_12060 [Thiohalobacter sp. IOR34]|uniref:hypothetical protein n=1 Tax=Thiohalobacter sp. IOR34 TaxID=3057176 RepID=UPI0025B16330|nr:hypothetical protein [Thiohalobacter sp. IOR34]WJW75209.1 hypothetical protein QVG61_12060 [Thiohalobacter sp. IOR34]
MLIHTNTRNAALASAIGLLLGGLATPAAQAALTSGSVLQFTSGAKQCVLGGTYVNNVTDCLYSVTTTTGSWFSMDSDGNGSVSDSERTPIIINAGLIIGQTQETVGQSHSGLPTGSETTTIDYAWNFFGNSGMHNTTSAVTVLSDDGAGNATLGMTGWAVDWNGIEDINMGGDTANFSTDTGIATLTCYSDSAFTTKTACADGVYFKLTYDAHVPVGDVSGFGGVPYSLYMEGTLSVPGSVTVVGTGTLASGDFGGSAVNNYHATSTLPTDDGYTSVGSVFDFKINCGSAGCSESVILPLGVAIPSDAVYRKYTSASGWVTFTEDANNSIASADSSTNGGNCVGATYTSGLTEGDDCLRLTMRDGDANDADGDATNGIISDPGTIAVANAAAATADLSSSTSGCSIAKAPVDPLQHGEWWLLGGLLALLGLKRSKV